MALIFRKSADCLDMVVEVKGVVVGELRCLHRTTPAYPRYAPDLTLAAWLDSRPPEARLPQTDWYHQSATIPVWSVVLHRVR